MGYHKKLYNKLYYYLAFCILTVTPVYAEGDTNNTSNPVAAATGNVTNQAVQFQNNGAPSRQQYGSAISCNGSTMTFSPFYMGNDTSPYDDEGYVISENWGFQINFSVPLNRDLTKQCQEIAKRQEEKMRLDYELVRALKCAELQQKGFTIYPGSRVAHMCQDIVPIQSLLPKKDVSTTKTNRFNFFKK